MKKILAIILTFSWLIGNYSCELREGNALIVSELADRCLMNSFRHHPEWTTFYGLEKADHCGLSDNSIEGLQKEYASEDSLYVLVQKKGSRIILMYFPEQK